MVLRSLSRLILPLVAATTACSGMASERVDEPVYGPDEIDQRPRFIRQCPRYVPGEELTGRIAVSFDVDSDGLAYNVTLLSRTATADEAGVEAALDELRTCRFRPATIDGRPVAFTGMVYRGVRVGGGAPEPSSPWASWTAGGARPSRL